MISKPLHTFSKAQVTSNKKHTTSGTIFRHGFNALSICVIHFAQSVQTTFSLVNILQQAIRNFHFKVFKANTANKMDRTM